VQQFRKLVLQKEKPSKKLVVASLQAREQVREVEKALEELAVK